MKASEVRTVPISLADSEYLKQLIAQLTDRAGPLDAEIVPGCTPRWHLIVTHPGKEAKAAEQLAERRFGVYLPRVEAKVKGRFGRPDTIRRSPMLRTYLFIFVWDVERHWGRIEQCEGVSRLMMLGERPFVVPDQVIDRLHVEEHRACVAKPSGKRAWRRRPKGLGGADVVRISCYGDLSSLADLPDQERISVFNRALGLAS